MVGQLTRYYRLFEEPRNYDNLKRVAKFIEKDSEGKKIKIYNDFGGNTKYHYETIFLIYFSEYNIKTSDEPEILYAIRDNITIINYGKERENREMQYLYDNNATELTNIGGYTIFKFPKIPNEE